MSKWLIRLAFCVVALSLAFFISWINTKPILSENGERILQSLQDKDNWLLISGPRLVGQGDIRNKDNTLHLRYENYSGKCDIWVRSPEGHLHEVGNYVTYSDRHAINKAIYSLRCLLEEKMIADQVNDAISSKK
jgi:hypothetical protein